MKAALLAVSLPLALAGCEVKTGVGAGSSNTTPEQPPPDEPPPATTGGTGGTGGAGTGPAQSADCPNPDNHCLPADDLFWASKRPWEKGWLYTHLASQQTPPDGAGEAKFMLRQNGEELVTKHFHKTYPAPRDQLMVGKMVVMFHGNKDNQIYMAPTTREDALGKRWWMARIVSVAPVSSGDYVIVSGGYKIATSNLRFLEGGNADTVAVGGDEDAHFFKDEHWLVSTRPLKDKGWMYVQQSAAIQPPSAQTKGDGHFMFLQNGEQVWSRNAWKTRPATKEDMKLGARVFMFHGNKDNKVYKAPRERLEALSKRWWTGRVTDDSTAYKGIVTVAGKYQIDISAVRVSIE